MLQEKVLCLQQTYLAKLPQILEQARAWTSQLEDGPNTAEALAELYRCFHNIKGTAASLGLQGISEISGAAVGLVMQLQHMSLSEQNDATVAKLAGVDALTTELMALVGEIPVIDPVNAEPAKAVMAAIGQGTRPGSLRGRIVIYDNADETGQLASQLARFGYLISVCDTPEALRQMVVERPPEAVLLSTDNIDLAAELHLRVSSALLFMAEQDDFNTRLSVVRAGGSAYFLKPVTAYEMLDMLDELTIAREPDPYRVLIVDDEPEMASFLKLVLDSTNMQTRLLDNPALVMDVLRDFQPDLVLMDMYMPEVSGRELSSLIRQVPQFVGIPILFLSSETDKTIQLSAMRVGADGFLTKPILPEDLITAVAVRAERTRTMRSLMVRDSLTGLFNHTTLTQYLDTTLACARRHGGKLCFAMLDLDHFKCVNDNYGHPVGDQVLVALSRMLKQRLRSSDMVGRYGGEEFAVVMQHVTESEAASALTQILKDFSALTFKSGDKEFSCSFSAGIAGYPETGCAEQLVISADMALYAAKVGGRNRIVTASKVKEQ